MAQPQQEKTTYPEGKDAFWTALVQHLDKFYDSDKSRAIATAFRQNYLAGLAQLSLDDLETLASRNASNSNPSNAQDAAIAASSS